MENRRYDRRKFIRNTTLVGMGLGLGTRSFSTFGKTKAQDGKRVGIIGLDTSHAVAFTKELNVKKPDFVNGYQVVAAYPKGSLDIESSYKRIPKYTQEVKELGVKIVPDINALLEEVDVVMLETNDGKRHLDQVLPVLKMGKPVFIDKPVAASLIDTLVIYEAAKYYKVPLFSSSSLRYMSTAQSVEKGEIGKVLGSDTYSPCALEKSHTDFFWYGVHGIEILYTVMGPGCEKISRTHTNETDLAIGLWEDDRIGTFRGMRNGKHTYGGTAYGEKGDKVLGPYEGYNPLLKEIINFFETGQSPIDDKETIEIYTFMQAADESRLINGGTISLQEVYKKAERIARKKLNNLI